MPRLRPSRAGDWRAGVLGTSLAILALSTGGLGDAAQHADASSATAQRLQARGFLTAVEVRARLTKRMNVAEATRTFDERPNWRRTLGVGPSSSEPRPAPDGRREERSAGEAPSGSPFRGRVGVGGAMIWTPQDDDQLAQLRRARALGLSWVREDFHWGAFEPKPGDWDWALGDRLMRNAARSGMNILPVVAYSAGWAASGPTIYHPPRDPAAYAEFCRRIVARYGPGGTFWRAHPQLESRAITAVEIWNEPWHEHFWRPSPNAAAYAALLRAAGTAIHNEDSSVKVLASADIFQGRTDIRESRDWFAELVAADPDALRTAVDAYSVHLYVQGRSPADSTTAQRWRFDRLLLTRSLAASIGAAHPIWITEFGWSTYAGHPDAVSEETQARYTREALERITRWEFVERSFIFFWGNSKPDRSGGHGLFRSDGTPKPVVDTLSQLLDGA
jgi:Glycosyl hydrolase catalytic core